MITEAQTELSQDQVRYLSALEKEVTRRFEAGIITVEEE